jgi:hypothetical protein
MNDDCCEELNQWWMDVYFHPSSMGGDRSD